MMDLVYWAVCLGSIRGMMNPIAFRNAPNDLSLI